MTWHAVPAMRDGLEPWLRAVFPLGPESPVRVLQASAGRCVVAREGWVLKASGPRPGRSRLLYGVRPSGARRAFDVARMLIAAGIPTHEPLAWATERVACLRRKDYLLTRELTGTELLTVVLDRESARPDVRGRVLVALGELLAAFHARGLVNRDLKDANLRCSCRDPAALWVTDLEGVRRVPRLAASQAKCDFDPVLHSLRCHGWLRDAADAATLFAAYNARVPPALCQPVPTEGRGGA